MMSIVARMEGYMEREGYIDTLNKAFLNMKNDLFSTFEFQDGG